MNGARPSESVMEHRHAERDAYEWCRAFTRSHSENFTVVSWFLPQNLRRHFFAVYAFCRMTDDLGDEAEGDRLQLLASWEERLRGSYAGDPEEPLFVALQRTVRESNIPQDLFLRLIEANRMDQRHVRFRSYEELRHYCEHSATPVGRMVLCILGYTDEERMRLSDATCHGLQLANFWQDVSVDLSKDRVYIPEDDMCRFSCNEQQLKSGTVTDGFRELMRFEVERARACFAEGRGLENLVSARVRPDIRLFRQGGEAVLDAIERRRYDVLTSRPRIASRAKAWMLLNAAILSIFSR